MSIPGFHTLKFVSIPHFRHLLRHRVIEIALGSHVSRHTAQDLPNRRWRSKYQYEMSLDSSVRISRTSPAPISHYSAFCSAMTVDGFGKETCEWQLTLQHWRPAFTGVELSDSAPHNINVLARIRVFPPKRQT